MLKFFNTVDNNFMRNISQRKMNAGGKGQLNSEWIYEVIVCPKMPTKNYKDFCPGSLLEGRAEIIKTFGRYFERNDDLKNSFWI